MSRRRLHRQVRLDKAMGRRQRQQSKRRNGCASIRHTHTAGREGCEDSRRQRATLGPAARSVGVCPAGKTKLSRNDFSGPGSSSSSTRWRSFNLNQRFQSENCELSLSPKIRSQIQSASKLWSGLSVCGVAVVDHIETIRRTRPMCGFVGSEYTSQTRTPTRKRKCCVPICSIGIVCGANCPSQTLPHVLVVSLRKLLRQLWSDHPQMTILKLKFARLEPRQMSKNQAAWTTAKRTGCSVDFALSCLMMYYCVPIGAPNTRRT